MDTKRSQMKNYGRDKTVVWWIELVILHMVLLNDVPKIVVVPQIQYIAVCHGKTSSPKLQVCPETVDICSKSMEWSMFLSWCRGFFPPFKTKKKPFCLSPQIHSRFFAVSSILFKNVFSCSYFLFFLFLMFPYLFFSPSPFLRILFLF